MGVQRMGMKQSPSMLFDILTEEDASKAKQKLDHAAVRIRSSMSESDHTSGCDAASSEGDQSMSAEPTQGITPVVILQELLGDLFIHPCRLKEEGLLGQGAFATVHKCTLEVEGAGGLKSMVAVKRLKPEVLGAPGDLKDFLTEANLLRKLRHPRIVTVYGIGASKLDSLESMRQSMYVVMEALDVDNLRMMVVRQMTSRTPVYTPRDALRWCIHIAEAMHYLHSVCRPMIIHRDLKLENILLSAGPVDSRQAKLADFGLHKRARLTANALPVPGAPVADVFMPGSDHNIDRSYYGGALGASLHNASIRGGSVYNEPSIHLGKQGAVASNAAALAVMAMANVSASASPRSRSLQGSLHRSNAALAVLTAASSGGNLSSLDKDGTPKADAGTPGSNSHRGMPTPGAADLGPSSEANPLNPAKAASVSPPVPVTPFQMALDAALQHAGSLTSGMPRTGSYEHLAKPHQDSSTLMQQQAAPVVSSSAKAGMAAMATAMSAPVAVSREASATAGSGAELMSLINDPSQHHNVKSLARVMTLQIEGSGSVHGGRAAFEGAADITVAEMAALPGDRSVHRKMLALMALDQHASQDLDPPKAFYKPPFAPEEMASWPADQCPMPSRLGATAATAAAAAAAAATAAPAAASATAAAPFTAEEMASWPADRCPMPPRRAAAAAAAAAAATGSTHGKAAMGTIPEDRRMSHDSTPQMMTAASRALSTVQDDRTSRQKQHLTSAASTPLPQAPSISPGFLDATQQVGSLMYMAPELLAGKQYNGSVDVFSFAIMMYELFTGRLLAFKAEFCEVAAIEEYARKRSEGFRDRMPSYWPQELRDLVAACWHQDPTKRPNFAQILIVLKSIDKNNVLSNMSKNGTAQGAAGGCCTVM